VLLFNKVKDPEPFFVNPPEPEIIPLKLPMELLFNVRVLPDEIDIPPLPDNPANSTLLFTLYVPPDETKVLLDGTEFVLLTLKVPAPTLVDPV